jgi:simple sugar transport system substrate-binding protein
MRSTPSKIVGTLCITIGISTALPIFAGPQRETAAQYTAVSIPKFASTWFDRMQVGLEKAGAELSVTITQEVPSPATAAQQVKLVENATNQGSDAILVVPDDAESIEAALAGAQAKKIVTITHQSPDQVHADYDVEMIDDAFFGHLGMEEMVVALGSPEGKYAVYVGSFTRPDHNTWADAAVALARQKYPGLKLVGERFPVSEDVGLACQTALDLLAAYPDIRGFLVFGDRGGPGVAQALRQKGLVGKIAVISTTGPSEASPYLKDGSLSASVLWDPADTGYAMVYLARLALDGKRNMIGADLDIPGLGKPLSFAGNTMVFDRPIILTKENVDEFSGF